MRIALVVPVLLLVHATGCKSDGTPAGDASTVLPPPDTAVADPVDTSRGPDLARNAPLPVAYSAWPSDTTLGVAHAKNMFGANVSGLVYEPADETSPAVLWAVQNEPSKLHKLTWSGTTYSRVATEGWVTGKSLRYPGGTGSPDGEGLTRTAWDAPEIYVVAERDNDVKDTPRQSILRYDLTSTKGVLDATHEWNLTNDLPAVTVTNSGLEGIAWIPDTFLVEKGFYDEAQKAPYDPAVYPNHGAGIFLVGVDVTGTLYAYVLDHVANTFTRVASFSSKQSRSVDITFDRDNGTVWSLCDNNCNGRFSLFDIETDALAANVGRFVLRASVPPPTALKDMNNEGFALAPEAECVNNRKAVVWADDSETGGFSLRRGTLACGRLY